MNIDYVKAAAEIEKRAGLVPFDQFPAKKNKIPHRIRWNGKLIKLRNGKTIWPSIGAAKNALRGKLNLNSLFNETVTPLDQYKVRSCISSSYARYDYIPSERIDEFYIQLISELQTSGVLVFEPASQ